MMRTVRVARPRMERIFLRADRMPGWAVIGDRSSQPWGHTTMKEARRPGPGLGRHGKTLWRATWLPRTPEHRHALCSHETAVERAVCRPARHCMNRTGASLCGSAVCVIACAWSSCLSESALTVRPRACTISL